MFKKRIRSFNFILILDKMINRLKLLILLVVFVAKVKIVALKI